MAEVLELLKKRNERKRQSGRNYGGKGGGEEGQVNFSRVRSDKDEAASTLSPGENTRSTVSMVERTCARGRCSYFSETLCETFTTIF